MTEIVSESALNESPSGRSLYRRLRAMFQNPMTVKELRGRMRGRRAFVILTVYLFFMSLFVGLIYAAYASATNAFSPSENRDAGKVIFSAVLGIQLFLVLFIGPAFTSGSISGERERQTYDLLRTTLLTAKGLVRGKLLSALSYVLLLVFAAVPLQSIAFLLGGVDFIELLVSQLLLVLSAVAFGLIGMYASSMMRTTLASTVSTYAITLFLIIGIPLMALFTLPVFSLFYSPVSTLPDWVEAVYVYFLLFVCSFNLPATLIVSDVFLIENDALFFWSETFGTYRVYLPSPWWLYVINFSLIAIFLYLLTVRRVRQVPKR